MKPPIEAPGDIPLAPDAARPMPAPAMAAVRRFGIRRTLISTTVATSAPEASAANATLEIAGNRGPEDAANRVAEGRNSTHCEDGDQRHQQSVLEEVLAVLRAPEPGAGELPQRHHCGWRLHRFFSSKDA